MSLESVRAFLATRAPDIAIVELDGSQHAEQAAYDARRGDFMRSYGFRVLRFWNGHVTAEMEAVLDTIFAALHRKDVDGRYD